MNIQRKNSAHHFRMQIPLSPRLSSNIPSRNCFPLSNLFNLPVQSEIKARFLTSTECVQSLKDK